MPQREYEWKEFEIETDDNAGDPRDIRPPLERYPYPTVKLSDQFDAIPESKAASNWMTAA